MPETAKIFGCGKKSVLYITGGGTGVFHELLSGGGGSAFLLEGRIPYSQSAFREAVGTLPDKFVSEDAAFRLALAAFEHGCALHDASCEVVGLGATCSLAKAGERQGREHNCYVAVQTVDRLTSATVHIVPPDTRVAEEALASRFILQELLHVCTGAGGELGSRRQADGHVYSGLWQGQSYVVAAGAPDHDVKVLFPGAFNLVHDGHLKLAEFAHEHTGLPVDFEISATNVDKGPISFFSLNERVAHFKTVLRSGVGSLLITRAGKFIEKARIFPGVTFVVGLDTFARITDKKYYKNEERYAQVMAEFQALGTRWLIFPRGDISEADYLAHMDKAPSTLVAGFAECVYYVPLSLYRSWGISGLASSKLRCDGK